MYIKTITAEETFPVRIAVLRKGIPLPHEFPGDFDAQTTHFGLYVAGQLVSVATVLQSSHPYFEGKQFQLRGMATMHAYQGKGIGSVLLKHIIGFVQEQQGDVLWFNARIKALPFYQRLGFEPIGPKFDIEHVGGHFVMFTKYNSLGHVAD